ncbi:hypothetical protein GCM10009737_05910 [Nocardioides lentus]|uniref:Anti-sigma factor n=1 Tax=Nocardioides lentus TaxID=338077 RepID=A0ABN2NZG1_9ACTN
MTDRERPPHEAALIAGAVSGDLDPEGRRTYEALVAADPSVAAETASLREVWVRLGRMDRWVETDPDPSLTARVLGLSADDPDVPGGSRPVATPVALPPGPRPRGRWLLAAAAAVVLLVVGGATGTWLAGHDDGGTSAEPAAPTQGPPGTLGAVEPIDFAGEPAAVDIDASLVAHTWGTETVLDMDGFTPGEPYRVVLVGADGGEEQSGTFLGSEVRIACRMNGALLREDVDAVEIRDADGDVVATSDVPTVTAG